MECEGFAKWMNHLEDKRRDLKEWSFNVNVKLQGLVVPHIWTR